MAWLIITYPRNVLWPLRCNSCNFFLFCLQPPVKKMYLSYVNREAGENWNRELKWRRSRSRRGGIKVNKTIKIMTFSSCMWIFTPQTKKALSSASLWCGLLPWIQKVALKSWTVRLSLHSFSSMCCHMAGGSLKNLLLMRILYLKIVLLLTVKMDRISSISSTINFIFHNLFQLHATFLSFLL